MTANDLSGVCLCGAVKFKVTPPFAAFRYCFCSRCRKASGAAHAANLIVPEAQFQWVEGEASVKRFDLPGAKRFAVSFCPACGTRVPHKINTTENMLVPAGLLDSAIEARPENSIFWNSKVDWYVSPENLPKLPEYT
jgi:hypothetical protein